MKKKIFKILLLTILLFPLSTRTSPAQGIYDWSSIENGTNGVVNAITVYNNKIVIGGSFTQAGGVPANNIAQWDGANWQPVGTGFTDEVYALAVFNGDLIAAGKYLFVNSIDTARIFSYNGSSWQPLGKGFVNRTNEFVKSLLVHDGKLYAAGSFKLNFTSGGASNVAVLESNTWDNLGDGLDLEVMCMTSDGSDIIAGGKFSSSDTAQVNHVARWNNGKWQRIGNGLNGNVYSLTKFNSEIVAGGEFQGHVSRWNSTSWQTLGNGVSDTVKSFGSYQSDLIVGGSFRYAGLSADSLYVNGIALWNGSSWAGLRTGMNSDVRSLLTDNNKLYAVGGFISAGGDSVNHVAYWDTIQTIVISGNVHYVGGPNVISGVAKSLRYDTYTRGVIYYDSSQVQPDGSYQVRVPKDRPTHIIIIAEDEDAPTYSYIPTYYPATIYWENATVINQSTNGTGFDVEVERITNTTNPGSISGQVFLDYTPPGYPTGNNLDIHEGAIVYARVGDSWKSFGISDRFSQYSLGNLPAGTYQLIVNRLGYTTQVKNNVVLSSGQQLLDVNFTLTISDGGSVNISGNTTIIPEGYSLLQNYPNPFNPVSKIKFELPEKGIVNLKVYNTAGQLVSELLNGQVLNAGIYSAEFDGGNLASGVYFYRLEVTSENGAKEFSGSKKMILIK
ncbi:MAG: carboxypeptidase regulatory-like domain-containing protein [Ignavibacteriae bacterium]|nr:carboxypeptidase regulatory-like domain-containing protein [Ignavibacteriota bacterium]MCB9243902.1 carboxypeptidase regulatory-like domain-containing protein [Ignavibacteriales bacterium]